MAELSRAKANPWQLKTPPGTSGYMMHVEEKDGKQMIVCTTASVPSKTPNPAVEADSLHASRASPPPLL